jgi:hypothetical protein
MKTFLTFVISGFFLFPADFALEAQTNKALFHKELQKYLPTAVKGFLPDSEPNGNTISMGHYLFSTVEQNFVRNEEYLKITIFDYSESSSLYEQSSLIWELGEVEQDEFGYARPAKFTNTSVAGWESFDKETQIAEIYIGINNRFVIVISAEGQKDTNFIKGISQPIVDQLLLL